MLNEIRYSCDPNYIVLTHASRGCAPTGKVSDVDVEQLLGNWTSLESGISTILLPHMWTASTRVGESMKRQFAAFPFGIQCRSPTPHVDCLHEGGWSE
jgi:hypothetical protein